MDRRYSERSAETSSSGSVSASRVSGAGGGSGCTWSAASSAAGLADVTWASSRRARNWYVWRRASRARTSSAGGRVSSTEPLLLGLKLSRRFDPVRLISPSRQLRMAARMSVSRSPGGRADPSSGTLRPPFRPARASTGLLRLIPGPHPSLAPERHSRRDCSRTIDAGTDRRDSGAEVTCPARCRLPPPAFVSLRNSNYFLTVVNSPSGDSVGL